jgi:hypothetical protein
VKASGILLDLLGPQPDRDGLVIAASSLTTDLLLSRVEGVFARRRQLASELDRSRTAVREAAARNFDLLLETVRARSPRGQ